MVQLIIAAATAAILTLTSATAIPRDVEAVFPKTFKLETVASNGPSKNNNLFLGTYHIGAGINAAVGTPSKAAGVSLHFNATDGVVYFIFGSGNNKAEEYLSLHDAKPYGNVPAGYYSTEIGVVRPTKGFSLNSSKELVYNKKEFPAFSGFAMCHNDKIDGVAGSGEELLWTKTTTYKSDKCSDVELKIVPA